MYIYIYVCIYIYIYIYVYMYTYVYIYIYIHIHTDRERERERARRGVSDERAPEYLGHGLRLSAETYTGENGSPRKPKGVVFLQKSSKLFGDLLE